MLYLYFSLGYLFFFLWLHLAARFWARDREAAFQRLNHLFYRGWLHLARAVVPGLKLSIAPEAARIRSAVVISNHISFFDTILMLTLFPRQKTIVKGSMLKVPFMGMAQDGAGYLPATADGLFDQKMADRFASLAEFFSAGGVLFVFPEGTRSRDGSLGRFKKGAFRIAARCSVPVEMLYIRGSDRLMPPGSILMGTWPPGPVEVEHLGRLAPDPRTAASPASEMLAQAERIYRERQAAEP